MRLVDELEQRLPFVGVRYLVNKVMGPRNAGLEDPRQKRELINRAVDDGVLEMYEVGNVEGRDDPVTACRLDRASPWKRFVHITLPLLRPAIVMVIILRMMTALSAFAAIFAATGGGPGSATEILNLYAYRTSFSELNLGYGASLAMVLLAITLAISFVMFRLRRAR